MATLKPISVVKELDAYTKGLGWEWGKRDCIGLLFHIVNAVSTTDHIRSDYIPAMGYKESIDWLLRRYSDPLVPYRRLLWDARIYPTTHKKGAQLILVYGGMAITSSLDKEAYPIHIVPGVVFQTHTGAQWVLMLSGMKSVTINESQIHRVHRYPLTGSN